MEFEIPLRIVPYVRTTRRQKFVDERYLKYSSWKNAFGTMLSSAMSHAKMDMLPPQTHLRAVISIEVTNRLNTWDLDNGIKAVLDASQGILIKDDRWVKQIVASKSLGSIDMIRLEIVSL